jgi:hypothetical protein
LLGFWHVYSLVDSPNRISNMVFWLDPNTCYRLLDTLTASPSNNHTHRLANHWAKTSIVPPSKNNSAKSQTFFINGSLKLIFFFNCSVSKIVLDP